jgi:outer membrane lipoprotein-sorting protein
MLTVLTALTAALPASAYAGDAPGPRDAPADAAPDVAGEKDGKPRAGPPERRLGGKELDAFLTETEKGLGKLESLVASFEQEKHLAILEDVVHARGVIMFARPGRLRWEITEPFHTLLVVNGEAVGKFEFRDGNRRKLRLGTEAVVRTVAQQISLWHRGRFREQSARYDIQVHVGGRARVLLVPKNKEMRKTIRGIEMLFSKDRTRIDAVSIFESGGDRTVIRFSEERRNAEVPERMFDVEDPAPFEPPRAVEKRKK